uniref:DM13 domain-containing protein n=1 Tax=Arthrobacter sp. Ld5 TaxID=649152 RepID=UPI003EBF5AD7
MTPARTALILGGSALAVLLLVVAAIVFKPWLLFVDVRVNDDIPAVAAAPTTGTNTTAPDLADTGGDGGPAPTTGPSTPQPTDSAAGPALLSRGPFIDHEHPTSGTASIIVQPDGSRLLAIEGLQTTNGPDVHVWLSAADVVEGLDGWYTAGSAERVDLGPIKGNQGDQVYPIPDDVDLDRFPAV